MVNVRTMLQLLLPSLLILSLMGDVQGHVTLTFPRARLYDLDFLDNARTPGPCGMPKGDIKTSLLSGSNFNVTWHLAYPHRGGFKLQILDALDRPLVDLTPVTKQSEFVEYDATAQNYLVELPANFTCTDCTVRLLREAEEWGTSYRFWSCADVDIVDKKTYREDCSGHGRSVLGRCRCDRFYHGVRCQYREECLDDSDCGTQGVCIDNGGTTAPTKHCYCNIGWFGHKCSKRSVMKNIDLDLQSYTMKRLSTDFTFYWRILKDTNEFEGVAVVKGTSWVGIGWRPSSLTSSCRAVPEIRERGKKGSPEPLPRPEPKSEPEPNTEPEILASELGMEISSEAPKIKFGGNNKRSAKHDISVTVAPNNDVTVQTSVTYRVSTHKGRKKRSPQLNPQLIGEPTREPEPNSEPEPKSEPVPKSEPESISEPDLKNLLKPKSELKIEIKQTLKSDLKPKPEPKSMPEPKCWLESKNKATPKCESKPQFEPESKTESELISELVPKSEPEPKLEAEPSSEPNSQSKSESKSEPISESESQPEPKSKSDSSSKPEPKYDPKSEPKPSSEPHSEDSKQQFSSNSGTSKVHGLHKYIPKHDFNPMDCTDIIIGSARGMRHRIGDYFTRDRSTPRSDTFWGGKDSLTAAMGFEKDGYSTILFRRKLTTDEHFSDYEIFDGAMQVIWAKGQETGKYIHIPGSGIEQSKVSVKEFYKPDELKYHGHKSQRGFTTINFFEEKGREDFGGGVFLEGGGCGGEWHYPGHCVTDNNTCEYNIKWLYTTRKEEISFTIITKNIDTWTGIGFSKDEKMSQTDAILGWVDKTSGRAFLMDTWINGYNSPVLDASQDIFNFSGRIENGETILKFSRKRATKDNRDLSFTDNQCLYLMFPVKGGTFNPVNKKIRKHETVPIVSAQKVCIKSCGINEEDKDVSTPLPIRLFYDVEIRLVNLGNGYKAPIPGSLDFQDISNIISGSFSSALEKVPGFQQIKLNELQKNGNDGIIAKLKLLMDKNEIKGRALRPADTVAMTERVLVEALETRKIGALTVDPHYLVLRSYQQNDLEENDLDNQGSENSLMTGLLLGTTKLYIVIACLAALLALALLQASCTLYKASKKRTTKDRLIAKNAWRDYSASANTNFAFEAFETEEKLPPPTVSSLSRPREMAIDNGHTAANHNHQSSHQIQHQHRHQQSHIQQYHQQQHQQQHIKLNQPNQHNSVSALIPAPRATYSLPRAPRPRQSSGMSPVPGSTQGYYTQDRRNVPRYNNKDPSGHHTGTQPDFYFMPSQRKYSGEVVRVYVDYGNQKSK